MRSVDLARQSKKRRVATSSTLPENAVDENTGANLFRTVRSAGESNQTASILHSTVSVIQPITDNQRPRVSKSAPLPLDPPFYIPRSSLRATQSNHGSPYHNLQISPNRMASRGHKLVRQRETIRTEGATLEPQEPASYDDFVHVSHRPLARIVGVHSQLAMKARKRPIVVQEESDTDTSDSENSSSLDLVLRNQEDDSLISLRDSNPNPDLLTMLERLALGSTKLLKSKRLPFLRRNVRKSLGSLGMKMIHGHPQGRRNVRVIYTFGQLKYEGHMIGWKCPLCKLYDPFQFMERPGLDLHLRLDHGEFEVSWEGEKLEGTVLRITVPELWESDSEDEDILSRSSEDSAVLDEPWPPSMLQIQEPEVKPIIFGAMATPTAKKVDQDSLPVINMEESQNMALTGVRRPQRPIDPADPERYPTPPPYDNLEGPSAVYPFLPANFYSARPGGPKLYDLLNTLPLEPFGMMDWYVVDKEDDIFEVDNVRDEDKVMQALWSRWIFLNRSVFVANYQKGVRMFIDEYWRFIHRAAGFSALRILLLLLVSNRFITGEEFCDLMKHYSDLVGMDLWK